MLHEAVHQLAREVVRLPRTLREGDALPGRLLPDTYPLWWIDRLQLSGDLHADLFRGRLIPLRDLVQDTGPPVDGQVNLYYLQFWSVARFLMERDPEAFREVARAGGTLDALETHFGPVAELQDDWYVALQAQLERVRAARERRDASR